MQAAVRLCVQLTCNSSSGNTPRTDSSKLSPPIPRARCISFASADAHSSKLDAFSIVIHPRWTGFQADSENAIFAGLTQMPTLVHIYC